MGEDGPKVQQVAGSKSALAICLDVGDLSFPDYPDRGRSRPMARQGPLRSFVSHRLCRQLRGAQQCCGYVFTTATDAAATCRKAASTQSVVALELLGLAGFTRGCCGLAGVLALPFVAEHAQYDAIVDAAGPSSCLAEAAFLGEPEPVSDCHHGWVPGVGCEVQAQGVGGGE